MLRSMPWHLRELAWQCFDTVWVESLEVFFAQKSSFFTKCPIKKLGVLCRIWSKPFQRRTIRSVPSVYPFFAQNQWRSPGPKTSETGRWDFSGGSTSARWTTRLQNAPHPAWYKVSYSQIWTKKVLRGSSKQPVQQDGGWNERRKIERKPAQNPRFQRPLLHLFLA